MLWRSMSGWSLAACISACTPTLDWREVRPEGSGARAWFPCKPVGHSRDVALAGSPVKMTLHACSAGDAVFALGFADVATPARVTPALAELRDGAARNLGVGVGAADVRSLMVEGMTPNPQSARVRLAGHRPDGAPVTEELAVFSRGTVVYQATVLGAVLDAAAVQTFVDGLKVAP